MKDFSMMYSHFRSTSETSSRWSPSIETTLMCMLMVVSWRLILSPDTPLPLFNRHELLLRRASINLPRAGDPLGGGGVHFDPVGDPAGEAAHGEEDGKHLDGDVEGPVDDAGVEV